MLHAHDFAGDFDGGFGVEGEADGFAAGEFEVANEGHTAAGEVAGHGVEEGAVTTFDADDLGVLVAFGGAAFVAVVGGFLGVLEYAVDGGALFFGAGAVGGIFFGGEAAVDLDPVSGHGGDVADFDGDQGLFAVEIDFDHESFGGGETARDEFHAGGGNGGGDGVDGVVGGITHGFDGVSDAGALGFVDVGGFAAFHGHADFAAAVGPFHFIHEGAHEEDAAAAGEFGDFVGVEFFEDFIDIVAVAVIGDGPLAAVAVAVDVDLDFAVGVFGVGAAGGEHSAVFAVGAFADVGGDFEVTVDHGVGDSFGEGDDESGDAFVVADAAVFGAVFEGHDGFFDEFGAGGDRPVEGFGHDGKTGYGGRSGLLCLTADSGADLVHDVPPPYFRPRRGGNGAAASGASISPIERMGGKLYNRLQNMGLRRG